tara:strand:+ start:294 stop:593 length:300 start_codon:yes stop_codon:yes gene_type:complete
VSIEEILSEEGIVVRRIPYTTRRLSFMRPGGKLREGERIEEIGGRELVVSETKNKFGGKYFVEFARHQSETVRFSKKYSGVGDTIEEAYTDYMQKTTPK